MMAVAANCNQAYSNTHLTQEKNLFQPNPDDNLNLTYWKYTDYLNSDNDELNKSNPLQLMERRNGNMDQEIFKFSLVKRDKQITPIVTPSLLAPSREGDRSR